MNASALVTSILCRLGAQGERARGLRALVFDSIDRTEVMLFRRKDARQIPYPSLSTILLAIKRTCRQKQIRAEQLKRICFFSDRINFEYQDDDGRHQVQSYWVANTLLHATRLAAAMRSVNPKKNRFNRDYARPGQMKADVWPEVRKLVPGARRAPYFRRVRTWFAVLLLAGHRIHAEYMQIFELAPTV